MSRSPDLNEMVVFARVVEAGSFTAAAAALGLPKSTVSRRVSDLEGRLGARLLQRTTRKLSLTDAGRTYYGFCARVVGEIDEAENAVRSLQGVPRGRLRVTAPLNFSFLGALLTDFARTYPEVVLDVVSTDRVVDLVEEGFDVAIRAGKLADSTLVARPLGRMQRMVVAAPRYVKRRGRPRAPGDLAEHDSLVFGAGTDPTRWSLQDGATTVDVVVAPRLVVNDFDVLCEAAAAGLGIAMLPEFLAAEGVRERRLVRVLEAWSSPPAAIHVVYPSTRHLSPKVSAFVDHLRKRFADAARLR